MGDTRGKGFETPTTEHPAYEPCTEMGEVPEKDPGKHLTKMKRLSGSTPASSQKVREFPSH